MKSVAVTNEIWIVSFNNENSGIMLDEKTVLFGILNRKG